MQQVLEKFSSGVFSISAYRESLECLTRDLFVFTNTFGERRFQQLESPLIKSNLLNNAYYSRLYIEIMDLTPITIGVMLKKAPTPSSTRQSDRMAVRRMLEKLRAHRLRRNWTQAEMARRSGLSRPAYQNFEGGYGNITLSNLMRVLGILGFASRIADLVPELEDERTLESVNEAPRQRAREKRRRLA